MTFWLKMALASAASRKWILAISLISIGISSAVILSVAQIRADVRNSFASAINGVDLIVGSRDSPTELLMYTVFGLGQASRSMPFSTAQTIAELPGVAWVIPIQLGDFYNDSPVMGTESSFFKRVQVANQALTFASGREFTEDNKSTRYRRKNHTKPRDQWSACRKAHRLTLSGRRHIKGDWHTH